MIRRWTARFVQWLLWPKGKPSASAATAVTARQIDVSPRSGTVQPQSPRDIRPIVEMLQRIDPLLDIVWNPKEHVIAKGSYSETGTLIPPVYDGRWNVIRHQTENLHPERGDYAVLCVLSEPSRKDGILYVTKDGPYAPVGEWVVELMRSADAQNVRQHSELRRKLWAQSDALVAAEDRIDEGEAREGLDRVLHKVNYEGGRGKYPGQGADFAPIITTP